MSLRGMESSISEEKRRQKLRIKFIKHGFMSILKILKLLKNKKQSVEG